MQMQQLRSGAQQQATRATTRCRPSLSSSSAPLRRVVRARAEPPNLEGNVTREYREDTGEVSVPTSKNADGSLYVDVNAPVREMKPRENISKEMKARLRKEYTDFGGTESKTPRSASGADASTSGREGALAPLPPHRRLPGGSPLAARLRVVAAASVADEELEAAAAAAAAVNQQHQHQHQQHQAAAAASSSSPSSAAAASSGAFSATSTGGGSKWTIDPNEELRSTPEHRLWTYGPMGVMAATYALAWSHALSDAAGGADAFAAAGGAPLFLASLASVVPVVAASGAAYVLSDLGTAVYHWFVDNYGDGKTPIFGRQIAAFQGHHQRPWTITQREFANNLHQVFKPAFAPAAVIALLALLRVEPGGPAGEAFASSFLMLVCMSQQFHAWSHMKRSELHPIVLNLQERGVLIGRKAHGAHHRPNFEGNYAIVSGVWNAPLDGSGFFRGLEKVVAAVTGVEPRCWHAPEYGWAEEARPAGMTMSSDLDEE